MYKSLIKQFIEGVSPEDLKRYLTENDFTVTSQEIEVLYEYLKTRWEDIYDGKSVVFEELQQKLNPDLYQKLWEIYQETKKKYHI